jgi:hypothetical protein
MSSITNDKPRTHRLDFFILLFLVGFLIFFITGCATPGAASPDPDASSAAVVDIPEETATPEPTKDSRVKAFNEIATYADGVSISVSAPAEFTPSELAYPQLAEGESGVVFKLVLTNNSSDILEPATVVNVTSGGKLASYISDVDSADYPDLGAFPMASVLPGQTIEWYLAYGVVDPANITLDAAPVTFMYDNMIFTNVK